MLSARPVAACAARQSVALPVGRFSFASRAARTSPLTCRPLPAALRRPRAVSFIASCVSTGAPGDDPIASGANFEAGGTTSSPLPSPSPLPPSSVYLFWNFDSLWPEEDTGEFAVGLERLAAAFGKPELLLAVGKQPVALYDSDGDEYYDPPLDDVPLILRCPMCGQKMKSEEALEKHFKNLHEREQKKRTAHRRSKRRSDAWMAKTDKYNKARGAVMAGWVEWESPKKLKDRPQIEPLPESFTHMAVSQYTSAWSEVEREVMSTVNNGDLENGVCILVGSGSFKNTKNASRLLTWLKEKDVMTVYVGANDEARAEACFTAGVLAVPPRPYSEFDHQITKLEKILANTTNIRYLRGIDVGRSFPLSSV